MTAETITREEIERILASDPFPNDGGALPWQELQAVIWPISNRQLRVLLERALAEPARLAAARAEGVRELAARIRAILADDAVCCDHPDMRGGYPECCGCPVERDPAEIVERVRGALAPSPAEAPTTPTVETDDGWIEWKGGECPVEPDAVVEVRMRDGRTATFDDGAVDEFWWGNDGCSVDILAYRIVKPAEPSAPVALTRCQAASLRNDGECHHRQCPVPAELGPVSRLHCTLPGGGADDYDEDDLPPSAPVAPEFDDEDMAAVGRSLMEALHDNREHARLKGWAPADGPAEIVVDMLNWLDDGDARVAALEAENAGLRLDSEGYTLSLAEHTARARRLEAENARLREGLGAYPNPSKYHGARGFEEQRFFADYDTFRSRARALLQGGPDAG